MKIVKLTSENVKRLSVVEVTPDGSIVIVGGKNGAGKSSVLDSIAYVLGGEKLIPTQPIRKDQAEAKIVVDLGDYVVTRRFYRELLNPAESDPKGESPSPKVWGETKSVLTVTNKEGARYPSPQVLLDKLYGKLSFDPLAFKNEKPDKQNEILRRLVNLDFTLDNAKRKTAFEARAMHKKTLAIQQVKLGQLPHYPDVGTSETSLDGVSNEMYQAEEYRRLAEDAERQVSASQSHLKHVEAQCQTRYAKIQELTRQIEVLQQECETWEASFVDAQKDLDARKITAEAARAVVPDVSVIQTKLADIEAKNKQARANQARMSQLDDIKRLEVMIEEQDAVVKEIDVKKELTLQEAKFPVVGLGLSDDGVIFEGLPLSEVSASVQLRVSIAIGLALNPTLKVLLIRNGNLLDEDSLKLVAQQAEEAGAQVWMEYVTSSAEGVSVMLEDGHVQ